MAASSENFLERACRSALFPCRYGGRTAEPRARFASSAASVVTHAHAEQRVGRFPAIPAARRADGASRSGSVFLVVAGAHLFALSLHRLAGLSVERCAQPDVFAAASKRHRRTIESWLCGVLLQHPSRREMGVDWLAWADERSRSQSASGDGGQGQMPFSTGEPRPDLAMLRNGHCPRRWLGGCVHGRVAGLPGSK